MSSPLSFWRGAVDCPACGAGAPSGLAIATLTRHGTDLTCRCCGLAIWEGELLLRGNEMSAEEVVERVRDLDPDRGEQEDGFRAPWERAWVLGLVASPLMEVPAAEGRGPADQAVAAVAVFTPRRGHRSRVR